MKSILTGLILTFVFVSSSAIAQGNTEDSKIMSRLNTGAYDGPYHKGDNLRPLYVIKDNENFYKVDALKEVNPDWIKKVEVLKGKNAEDIFGESGSNGVILITLKEDDKAAHKYFRTAKKHKIKM